MRSKRSNPKVLVIAERRFSSLVGLFVCGGIVFVFYYTLLGSGDLPLSASEARGGQSENILFLLFPLLLVPYFYRCLRVLIVGEKLTFDGESRIVLKNRVKVATFDEVRVLQLRALHSTCEEVMLCALLRDGRRIPLQTSDAVAKVVELADEIGEMLEVEVVQET